jgi:hypothetical protein
MTGETPTTTAELLRRIQAGWDDFHAYLKTLDEADFTLNADAAGWTAKDHIIHLSVWEDGIDALLSGESRRERMGVDSETWASDWHADGFFRINDVIYQQHKDKSLQEVMDRFKRVHEALVKQISALSDQDLRRPYRSFVSESKNETPIVDVIISDTYGHYSQHREWIEQIIAKG